MTLRDQFVIPLNLILGAVLIASLAWEWRRQEATGLGLLRTRVDEEARFVLAARRAFGVSPDLRLFLNRFCHAIDPTTSPEHQVALVDPTGAVVASAALHARNPLDPKPWADRGPGLWTVANGAGTVVVRVSEDQGWRVVLAESTRAVGEHVRTNLKNQAGWYLGAGALVFGVANLVMRRAVLRPIRQIHQAVRALEQGKLGVEIERPADDELGALARQFNAMSRELADRAETDRREMETARRVQSELLPPARLRLGDLDFAGKCIQAGPVGGDVYDVRLLPDGRVGLLIADLSGHNVAAALHTAMVRAIVWREAEQAENPGEVMARLNEQLERNLPEEQFATVFFGWFNPGSGAFHYANAGHPPALVVDASGSVRELEPTMPLLGVFPDLPGRDAAVELEAGARLLVFTDGLTETADPDGELWGTSDLKTFLADPARPSDPTEALARIFDRAEGFRHARPQQDDISVVLASLGAGAWTHELSQPSHVNQSAH